MLSFFAHLWTNVRKNDIILTIINTEMLVYANEKNINVYYMWVISVCNGVYRCT